MTKFSVMRNRGGPTGHSLSFAALSFARALSSPAPRNLDSFRQRFKDKMRGSNPAPPITFQRPGEEGGPRISGLPFRPRTTSNKGEGQIPRPP